MGKYLIKTLQEICGIGLLFIGLAIAILGGIFESSIVYALAGIGLITASFLIVKPKRVAELLIEGIFGVNP